MGQLNFFYQTFDGVDTQKKLVLSRLQSKRHQLMDEKRHDILEKAAIHPAVITPENIVAIKLDLGIPWEKLNSMAR